MNWITSVVLITLSITVLSSCNSEGKSKPVESVQKNVSQFLNDARKLFHQNKIDDALTALKGKLKKAVPHAASKVPYLPVIQIIGRIYLRVKNDPEGAIQFFESVRSSPMLNEAEQDIVEGWIEVSKDWAATNTSAKGNPDKLFKKAKRLYRKGVAKSEYRADPKGEAEFGVSSSLLSLLIKAHPSHPSVPEAYFMMGDIRSRSWMDNHFWSKNVYLIEAIRMKPHSPLAMKAWTTLNDEVKFGYSGSGGNHTPRSWKTLLADLRKAADPKTSAPIPHNLNKRMKVLK